MLLRFTKTPPQQIFKKWYDAGFTNYTLSKISGVDQVTLKSLRDGDSQMIRDVTWAKLRPHLAPYMEDGDEPIQCRNPARARTTWEGLVEDVRARVKSGDIPAPLPHPVTADGRPAAPRPLGGSSLPVLSLEWSMGAEEAAAGHGRQASHLPVLCAVKELPGMHLGHVRIEGSSMEPYLRHKDFVAVANFPAPLRLAEGRNVAYGTISQFLRDGDLICYSLGNSDELAIKRIRLIKPSNDPRAWALFLEADNAEWAAENGFPRLVAATEEICIYGKVAGRVEA